MEMRVKQLADEMGVTPDTVRYYTRLGILNPSRNPANGYKQYSQQDRSRLRFAVRARDLGFTLADIVQIVNHAGSGDSPCPIVRRLVEQRFADIESRFQDTQRLYRRMQKAMQAWQAMPDEEPNGEMICALIEQWEKP
jgi:DNA-binding transcriptional MerR regulator